MNCKIGSNNGLLMWQ